ncbi:MAG: hypothetical protein LV481_08450 [Methylacidiphilales bacterium]|nr:hypothetical protein [Candidatus Methylacidiphilales bacterium]
MKSLLPFLTFFLGIVALPIWAQPSSPEEFIAAYRTAMQEKSVGKLDALTYTVGMSDADKKQADSMQQMGFRDEAIAGITLEPLPADSPSVAIMNGKRYEQTYPPTGLIKIQYGAANGPDSSSQGYAIIGGHYFLVSVKSTDLGWKGPPDKPLTFMVAGWVKDKVQIQATWNTSGVDQEQSFNGNSGGGMGQYWVKFTVTSADDATDLTLVLSEDNKEIFRSPPLKGKGTIEYKK